MLGSLLVGAAVGLVHASPGLAASASPFGGSFFKPSIDGTTFKYVPLTDPVGKGKRAGVGWFGRTPCCCWLLFPKAGPGAHHPALASRLPLTIANSLSCSF